MNFVFMNLSSIFEINGGDEDMVSLFILSLVYSNSPANFPVEFFIVVVFVRAILP